jgi:D-alanyl-D-alanine carboxypeptidase
MTCSVKFGIRRRLYGPCHAALGLVILLCTICFSSSALHAKGNPRYASIVMDADTGTILYSRKADNKRHPASLAKIMTLMLVFEAIENGDLSLRDRVVISRMRW